MFETAAKKIGIAPITENDIETGKKKMDKRGLFGPKYSEKIKYKKVIKMLVKIWFKRELEFTEDEWDELKILEIMPNANN